MRPAPVTTARRCLGVIFLTAAIMKSADLQLFAAHIDDFRLVPEGLQTYCAVAIVAVEGVAALLLLLNCRSRASALVLGACTALFTAAMGAVLIRGLSVDCDCFGGITQQRVGLLSIGRNLLLLGGLLFVAHRS